MSDEEKSSRVEWPQQVAFLVFVIFLCVWIDSCACGARVSRTIIDTFRGTANAVQR